MSLTTTSRTFRKGIKILGVVALVYYVAILFVIPRTRDLLLDLFVDRNPPTPKFGILDPLNFDPTEINSKNVKIVLDTKDGRLPAGMPKKMPVFRVKAAQYSYLSGKNAQEDADKLGFKPEELVSDLKGREYQWRSLESDGELTINTETRAISLFTDMARFPAEYKRGKITAEASRNHAVDILKNIGRFNEKLYKPENTTVYLGQIIGSSLNETKVQTEAQFGMVHFFPKIGQHVIYGPDPQTGIIVVGVRSPAGKSPFNYPLMVGSFWDVDPTEDSTYSIITVKEAWDQVSAGKGVIASATYKNDNPFNPRSTINMDRILIRNIYIAYYMTPEYQRYLQPIYVFEGSFVTSGSDGGKIYIYYPAITSNFTRQVK
jgi:hypothetical protein